jgi:transposase InsO family protein
VCASPLVKDLLWGPSGLAYAKPWTSNDQRTAALDSWLEHYNTARSDSALGGRPPISRLVA